MEHETDILDWPIRDDKRINVVAMSAGNDGFAHALVAGEPFVGFSEQCYVPDPRFRSIASLTLPIRGHGLRAVVVKDVTPGCIGQDVFALGPTTFALSGEGSRVGFIRRLMVEHHVPELCLVEYEPHRKTN